VKPGSFVVAAAVAFCSAWEELWEVELCHLSQMKCVVQLSEAQTEEEVIWKKIRQLMPMTQLYESSNKDATYFVATKTLYILSLKILILY
jgi:hypothetical protein